VTDVADNEATQPPGPVAPAPDKRISLVLLFALLVLAAMVGGWSLLLVIFAIVVMIVLHELGHFIAAKKSGMKVTEFFLGFGPKLWSTTRGETEYGIKALPAGAYVKVIGMNNLEEVPPEDESRTYRAKSYPRRFAVGVAGSTMHFIQALVAIFIAFTIFGTPGGHLFTHTDEFRIKDTVAGSAAEAAGIRPGDGIVAIDGEHIDTFTQLHDVIAARPGKTVAIVVVRGGHETTLTATIGTQDGHGFLGVEPSNPPTERVNPITAAGRTVTEFGSLSKATVQFMGSFFSPSGLSHFADTVVNRGSPTVSGPDTGGSTGSSQSGSSTVDENRPISIVGAASIGSEITRDGPFAFLAFFASLNVVVGIFNLIPLLPLDGGHIAIATYERLRSRHGRQYRADVMKLMPLVYAVVAVLVVIGLSTVFLDIVDPIHLNN